jgi:hypothetical protein
MASSCATAATPATRSRSKRSVRSRRMHGSGLSTTPTALSRSGRCWSAEWRTRRARGAATAAEQLQQRAQSYEEGADLLRDLLAHGTRSGGASEDRDS